MRILLVSPLPPPMGGIATLTERMIDKMPSSEIQINCVNVAHRVDNADDKIKRYNKLDSIAILLRAVISVFFDCLARKCDIIHINSSSGDGTLRDYMIQKIAKSFKIPVVLHYHCNLEDATRNSKIATKFLNKSLDLANKILVLNTSSLKTVNDKGYEAVIVPNGVPASTVVNKHHINRVIGKVVFTGRVSKAKGCLELYACAKENSQIDFRLAGLIDEEIEVKMRSLSNIELLGPLHHNEIINLLDEADVFMFPTYSEGFSVSLLEAMSRGVPCVATQVGANLDMIENKGGIIVEPQNAEALLVALKEMSSPDARQKMSKWNLTKVRDSYTEEIMYNTLMTIYEEIIYGA